jgi:hypothetical protein
MDPLVFKILLAVLLVVALLSALAAVVASRRWPQKTIRQLVDRVVVWLMLSTIALTVGGSVWALHMECAPDVRVCDAPVMAAFGIIFLGAMVLGVVVVVGVPVVIAVLRLARRS